MTPSHSLSWPRGCWPDETQRLLLKACFLKDDDGCLAAWNEWQSRMSLDFADGSSIRMLLPLRDRLRRVQGRLPAMPRIEGVVRFHWAQTQMTQRVIGEVIELLEGAGIESILLKGAALAETVYPRGLRAMADVDMLIRSEDVDEALALLESEGWLPRFMCHEKAREFTHALQLDRSDHRSLDLHWDPFHDRFLDEARLASFWSDSISISVQGRNARVLCPSDQLLQICEHGVRYDSTPPFRWLGDAFSIIEKLGDQIDWQRCAKKASEFGLLPQIQNTLCFLESELGLELPEEASKVLNRRPSLRSLFAYQINARRQPGYHPVIQGLPRSLLAYGRYRGGRKGSEALGAIAFISLINDISLPPSEFVGHFCQLAIRSQLQDWRDRWKAAELRHKLRSSDPQIATMATTPSHLLEGFYPPELSHGTVFRWTYPDATIRLKLRPGDYWLEVDLLFERDWAKESLEILFNRLPVREVKCINNRIRIGLPGEAFADYHEQRLVLKCEPLATDSSESRMLGLALIRIVITPR